MNVARGNTDDMAYLVRQGQKEVVEEDGDGRNRSFSVIESMKMDAHPQCGPGDFGIQKSGESTRERDERKGAHR